MTQDYIHVVGARQNNLKGFHLKLPLGQLIVVTGVSGSGKSSLAFDTLYAEGQRRYVETFSPYARQFLDRMDRPRVDRIDGILPAIAIDQTNPVKTSRSTVGTMTELNDYLKLLYARAAQLHCRQCGQPVRRDTPQSIYQQLSVVRGPLVVSFPVRIPANFTGAEVRALLEKQGYRQVDSCGDRLEVVQDRVENTPRQRARLIEALEAALKVGQGRVNVTDVSQTPAPTYRFSADLHCAECDIHYRDATPNLFSFNSPVGACETCRGFGRTIGIDVDLVVPDAARSLAAGAIKPWQTPSYRECQDDLLAFAARRGIPTDVPWRDLTDAQRRWVLDGEGSWEERKWYGVKRFFEWLETKSYKMHVRVLLSRYRTYLPCQACGGTRLKPEAWLWRIAGKTIHEVQLLALAAAQEFFQQLKLPAPLDRATGGLLGEIRTRLRYLVEVGLGYLTLDRQSRTLSGGEVQRIHLTTALGTSLVNTLFVLDEPSIGLHPRDIGRLVRILHRLCDAGNTLVVVEHDPDVIRAADLILDLGPGPGERGGRVVFFGTLPQLLKCRRSLTGRYLAGVERRADRGGAHGGRARPREAAAGGGAGAAQFLRIVGAAEHNLKSIDVEIPLGRLVCVTGVSGSGKSTLVEDVLYRGLLRLKGRAAEAPGRHQRIAGHEHVAEVVLVDQAPIGKTTRSTPASYVGAFDEIRRLFAAQPLARQRGYTAGTFSFNSGQGRCPTCCGNGFEHIEMQFLSDVYLRCPDCNGRRYRDEVLEVKLAKRSIAEVLELTVHEACAFWAGQPEIVRALEPLRAVGLGYVKLGQPVPTLSGGEAQRLKLARHLVGAAPVGMDCHAVRSGVAGGRARPADGAAGGRVLPAARRATLFLFDEPTTGLHFADVAVLLAAFRQLRERGHSLVVIEHNLEVIRAADWIIDLGPEGGAAGGEIVCVGTPAEVARCRRSHTGRALAGQNRFDKRAGGR